MKSKDEIKNMLEKLENEIAEHMSIELKREYWGRIDTLRWVIGKDSPDNNWDKEEAE